MSVPNKKVELSGKQGFVSGRLHGRFRPLRFCFLFQNAVHFLVAILANNSEAFDRFQKTGDKVTEQQSNRAPEKLRNRPTDHKRKRASEEQRKRRTEERETEKPSNK